MVAKKKPIKQQPAKVAAPPQKKRDYFLIFGWIVIAIVSIIRYRLISVPLERDEGEYAYIGSLFLHGVAPFKGAYSMKLPGTPFMYAILMFIFGHTNSGIHLGMIFINAATMYLLYCAFKKIFNPFLGLSTAAIYGFMSIGLVFDGFAAHATYFICFYSSIGLLLLANYMKTEKLLKLFLFGLMLGMAFLMKQQAVFLILFGAIFLFIYLKTEMKQSYPEIIKKLFIFGSGVIIPYVLVFLIIVVTGQFPMFWLWTVKYASQYEAIKSLSFISSYFKVSFAPIWDFYNFQWVLALAGVCILYWAPYTRLQKIFAIGYFIASTCALCSGFYFRQHYFIVILPAIGLLLGIFIEYAIKKANIKSLNASIIVLSVMVLITVYMNRTYFFSYSAKTVCNIAYWGNPFNEAPEIAKVIKENTNDTDKIAVLGSEPEIYFYADRRAATGYLYMYPLVDIQPFNVIMQEQMIKEIEETKPAFIVFFNVGYSWTPVAGAPRKILEWGNTYTHANYSPIGFVDFYKDRGWQFFWGNDMQNHSNNAESFVIVFKKNPAAGTTNRPSIKL
jgi:Dolichyl-phosphate-mannose-protein mannosyltransferase